MLAVLGGVSIALAYPQPPPAVELRRGAPPGCPGQAALEREVAALLADHVPPPRATPARLHFRVERRGTAWHLHGEITSSELTGHTPSPTTPGRRRTSILASRASVR